MARVKCTQCGGSYWGSPNHHQCHPKVKALFQRGKAREALEAKKRVDAQLAVVDDEIEEETEDEQVSDDEVELPEVGVEPQVAAAPAAPPAVEEARVRRRVTFAADDYPLANPAPIALPWHQEPQILPPPVATPPTGPTTQTGPISVCLNCGLSWPGVGIEQHDCDGSRCSTDPFTSFLERVLGSSGPLRPPPMAPMTPPKNIVGPTTPPTPPSVPTPDLPDFVLSALEKKKKKKKDFDERWRAQRVPPPHPGLKRKASDVGGRSSLRGALNRPQYEWLPHALTDEFLVNLGKIRCMGQVAMDRAQAFAEDHDFPVFEEFCAFIDWMSIVQEHAHVDMQERLLARVDEITNLVRAKRNASRADE